MIFSKTTIHWLATCAAIAGLAGCGGYTSVDLGGNVSGLVTDGLVLANGTDTVAVAKNATTYKFPNQIGTHDAYAVTVQAQPANYTCVVTNTPGRASGLAITYVDVVCAKTTHPLTVTVSGVTGTGMILANGSDQLPVSADGSVTFLGRVAELDTYGIVVLQQPKKADGTYQTCTVQNGTGTVGTTDPTGIAVTCQ
jgi:hypothetical protein